MTFFFILISLDKDGEAREKEKQRVCVLGVGFCFDSLFFCFVLFACLFRFVLFHGRNAAGMGIMRGSGGEQNWGVLCEGPKDSTKK